MSRLKYSQEKGNYLCNRLFYKSSLDWNLSATLAYVVLCSQALDLQGTI